MNSDEEWTTELRAHLRGLDDPGTAEFRKALAQSYVYSRGTELEPFGKVGLATAGYTWARQAPWEGAGHGPFFKDFAHVSCPICAP